jgi:ubiquinone/menaquinone biosynthesis C-methylase UbiE
MKNLLKQAQDRLILFKKYGYDIPKARTFILRKAKLSGGKILEIGTGSGHMALALAQKGFKITSIDIDKKGQKSALARLQAENLQRLVSLRKMNAERLGFKDNSFDYVISVNFLHHAADPVKCVKEMIRVAKKELIIADINKNGERVMDKIHALEDEKHPASKMSMSAAGILLKKSGLRVKIYQDTCQTVLVAEKEK